MKLAMIFENDPYPVSTYTLLELFGGFMAACVAPLVHLDEQVRRD